jgi:NAD(P)-dependent dehydrogenase (short-subunit alcohol dehydrogenase family)
MRLKDKIGIVTAAASGMGRAGAMLFAKEGAAVALVDINAAGVQAVADQITKSGGKAIAMAGDLGDEAFSRRIVHDTVAKFGGLDFLWAHCGIPGPGKIEGLDLKEYDHAMNLNVRTTLATTSEAIPEMRKRGSGSVLYTSSTSGLRGSPVAPVYSIAKFGVIGLARSLAKQYGKDQIRFNVVCPGMIDTPMLPDFIRRPDQPPVPPEEMQKIIAQRAAPISLGRKGQPEDVARAALFLLSDDASFITGAALPVDGGILA